jgi:predicted nucleic acid-binding protein
VTPRTARRAGRARERAPRYSLASGAPVVVDASMAFLWFANEPDHWGAQRLLEIETALLAPDFMIVEATNAWWKKLRRREMDMVDVEQAVTNLLAAGIALTPAVELVRPAARLASELGHPVYDCVYLALAATRSASLATADERLRRGAERVGVRIWRATA